MNLNYTDIEKVDTGFALWSAIKPVFETTPSSVDIGLHLHIKDLSSGSKKIDNTFPEVKIIKGDKIWHFTYQRALNFRINKTLGFKMSQVFCPNCKSEISHNEIVIMPSKKCECNNCEFTFDLTEKIVINSFTDAQLDLIGNPSKIEVDKNRIELSKNEFEGGVRIWGTAPAILWKSPYAEKSGIHLHVYNKENLKTIDDTFGEIVLDGQTLPNRQIQVYTVQKEISGLSTYLKVIVCPKCGNKHFDDGLYAVKPHKTHLCEFCRIDFVPDDGLKCISNPFLDVLKVLSKM